MIHREKTDRNHLQSKARASALHWIAEWQMKRHRKGEKGKEWWNANWALNRMKESASSRWVCSTMPSTISQKSITQTSLSRHEMCPFIVNANHLLGGKWVANELLNRNQNNSMFASLYSQCAKKKTPNRTIKTFFSCVNVKFYLQYKKQAK